MRTLSVPSLLKRVILVCMVALMVPAAILAQTQTLPPASQVASQIKVGWNLGNTLEAQCGETAWGNPAASQQLINSVKAAGFNTIRIPAAWDCHANQSTFTIDAAWMARVKQVVDYGISQNMYVILNIHWDGGWLQDHPVFSFQTAVNQKQRAFWTQIANTFKSYDQHLLFAGTNEVHADFGTPTSEHITVQQSYLQTFVDAVRATGGNNATRTLVVQTYNTNAQHGLNFFTLPTDSATGRLIVEFHYYDPYDYTLNPNGSCLFWGAPFPSQSACTWAYESYVNDLFGRVRAKWVDQGIPVIMGEYGVATRPNLDAASRRYYLEYINRTAAQNGIKTFYWDNGVLPTQNNGFALFNRNSGAVVDQGALDAVLRGAGVGNTPTPTPTRTPTGAVRTNTPTRTPTGAVRTNTPTRTPTPGSGATCSPATTITAPFTFDGAGTFCWQIATIPSNINSWNLDSLTVNGVSFTNTHAFASALPPKINGFWYVRYTGSFAWSHFEAK